MRQLFKITWVLVWCFTWHSTRAFTPDSITIQCYQNDVRYTPIVVEYISNNQIDAVDSMYASLPKSCSSKGWNQLVNLFLVCVKYPERMEQLNESEMEFLIDYIYCIKHKQIYYNAKDTFAYDYNLMPAFHRLHEAVQKYLTTHYTGLQHGSMSYKLVGTILQKHNDFFTHLLHLEQQHDYSMVTTKSFMENKSKLKKRGHVFLHLNTVFVQNKQMGNAIHYEWAGLEIATQKYAAGLAIGVSFNTTMPTYQITYSEQQLTPERTEFFNVSCWYNRFLLTETRVKPYVGLGASWLESQQVFTINGDEKKLSVYGGQVYPEFGVLLGGTSHVGLKLHCSYRFNFMEVDYWGEKWDFTDMSTNIHEGDFRMGVAILINILNENRHKGKLVGLY